MGSAVFALVFLSSGYLLLRRWSITRPHALGWDGHALYFSVVIASIVLSVEADLFREILSGSPIFGSGVNSKVAAVLGTLATEKKLNDLGITAFWSVPLAVVSVVLLNIPIARSPVLRLQLYLRLSCMGELEEFLLTTTAKNLPVMLTMASAKVYIGFLLETNASRGKKEWIRIEPLLSGYRNDKQEFKDTTDYSWLHSAGANTRVRREDFDVIVPSSEVVSAHAFDLGVYVNQFKAQGNAGATNGTKTSMECSNADASIGDQDKLSSSYDDRGERKSGLPREKCEIFYWMYCISMGTVLPAAYTFGSIVATFSILLTALLAYASSVEGTQ